VITKYLVEYTIQKYIKKNKKKTKKMKNLDKFHSIAEKKYNLLRYQMNIKNL